MVKYENIAQNLEFYVNLPEISFSLRKFSKKFSSLSKYSRIVLQIPQS